MVKSKNNFNFKQDVYFDFCATKNESKCKINNCGKVLKGNFVWNLRRHVIKRHNEIAQLINLSNNDTSTTESECVLINFSPCKKSNKNVKMVYNSKYIKKACVSMCTKRGIPFSIFDIPEMKYFLDPYFEKYNVTVNAHNIVDFISEAAIKIKDIIKSELKNRIICIKVDAASRGDRKVLGVNCQFVRDGELIIRNLAVMDIIEKQTSINLKKNIQLILKDYDIALTQIGSITTDNGANMLRTAEMIKESQMDNLFLPPVEDISDDDIQTFDQMVQTELSGILVPVRCAAHTFQLAVLDVLKMEKYAAHLATFRNAIKKLKSVTYKELQEMNKIKKVNLDVPTRWGSAYIMIETFLGNKDFYIANDLEGELGINEANWEFASMFIEAFKPLFILNKKLQEENLIISDLFKIYLELTIGLKRLGIENIFKDEILAAVDHRKQKLFNNQVFFAGLFLDPRFNYNNSKYFPEEQFEPTIVRKSKIFSNLIYTYL